MKRFFPATFAGVVVTMAASVGLAQEKAEGKKEDQRSAVDVGAELATHEEVQSLAIEFERLTSLCLDGDGNLLACDAGAHHIKMIDADGRLAGTSPLEFGPQASDVAADGTIYCGGEGQLAKLDPSGKILRAVEVPEEAASEEVEKRRAASNPRRISGIAVSEKDLFAAYLRAWHAKGTIPHIQFNVVSGAELRAAKAEPAEHSDLIGRGAVSRAHFDAPSEPPQDRLHTRPVAPLA